MNRSLNGSSTSPFRDIVFLILCCTFLVLGALALNDLNLYTPDSTRYLVWAKSLSNLDGFHDTTTPEFTRYVVHAPLYAVFLSPAAKFFPLNIVAAKVTTLFFALLALALFYRWIRHATSRTFARIGSALLVVNPLFLLFSTEVLSDVPFTVFLILFFLSMEKFVQNPEQPKNNIFVLAAIIAVGILIREIGFAILISAVAFFLCKRKFVQALALFCCPLVVYGLWAYRNEFLIAPIELPPLKNSVLFSSHFFTPPSATFFQEIMARWSANISLYGKMMSGLVCSPMYFIFQFDLISPSARLLSFVNSILDYGVYVLAFATFVLTIIGIHADRQSPTFLLRVLFLGCYLAIVLSYPISDVRFLLPMLIVMMYYIMIATSSLISGKVVQNRMLRPALATACCLAFIPNIVWDATYISTNRAYLASPLGFAQTYEQPSTAPSHFTQPFSLASAWIDEHTDSNAVILSQWKDISCFIGNRKLYNVDQTIPLYEFEHLLRDYHVGIIASVILKNGLHEFEFQMHESHGYSFIPVARYANLELLEVRETNNNIHEPQTEFLRALTFLDERQYASAGELLSYIHSRDPKNLPALFYLAVAKEFQDNLTEADSLFSIFKRLPQAGMYLSQTQAHQQLISALRTMASQYPDHAALADAFARMSVQYWNLGFRERARTLIDDALQTDSTSFISMTFGIHFALLQQDTLGARHYFHRAKETVPDHPLVQAWKSIFLHLDTLSSLRDHAQRSVQLLQVGDLYQSMGLTDNAIDFVIDAVEEDPHNIPALSYAANLYESRRRYAPAMSMLKQILAIDNNQAEARRRLDLLAVHFQ